MHKDNIAYQTIKLVRTYDWRLSMMKRVFTSGVLLYIIFFIVLFHGYVEYEAPTVVTNPILERDADGLMLPYENSTASGINSLPVPDYCFGEDYVYTPGVLEYVDNYCISYLALPEYTVQRTQSVGITTYGRQVCIPFEIDIF